MKWLEKIQIQSEVVHDCRAIELGTTAARAVTLKRRRRKIKLRELHEVPVPRSAPGPPSPESMKGTLRQLVDKTRVRAEAVVSALPMHNVFIRNIVLPFTKPAQIQQVIASEAELHIPFPLDQVIIDFRLIEELKGGKSRVMMVAVKKELLRAHLELLAAAGIDPARVGIDFLGLANAFQLAGIINPREVSVLIEVGAGHTGGDAMSAAIMEGTGCTFEEAERLKNASGSDRAGSGPVEKAITASFANLETELVRTLHSAATTVDDFSPRHLILAGGAVSHPLLKEFLVNKVGCPPAEVDPWRTINTRARGDVPAPSTWSGLGLALSTLKPAPKILNFRQGEFGFRGSWEVIKRRLWIVIGLFLALMAVLAVGLSLKIFAERTCYDDQERQIEDVLSATIPDEEKVKPGDEVYEMEGALKRMQENFKYYQAFDVVSAFDILKGISQIIPPDIKVQVVELDINQDRVRFRGRTDSYRSAERIKNSFQQSAYFQAGKIQEGDTKTKMVGGKLVTVEFNYKIPLVTREE
jgi:type II secretion system protein L